MQHELRRPAAPNCVQLAREVERVLERDEGLHRTALEIEAVCTKERIRRIATMVDKERIKDHREDGCLRSLHQIAAVVPVAGFQCSTRGGRNFLIKERPQQRLLQARNPRYRPDSGAQCHAFLRDLQRSNMRFREYGTHDVAPSYLADGADWRQRGLRRPAGAGSAQQHGQAERRIQQVRQVVDWAEQALVGHIDRQQLQFARRHFGQSGRGLGVKVEFVDCRQALIAQARLDREQEVQVEVLHVRQLNGIFHYCTSILPRESEAW